MQTAVGKNYARQKALYRARFGAPVLVGVNADGTGGTTIYAEVEAVTARTHEIVREGSTNAADADLHVFDCSPADFVLPGAAASGGHNSALPLPSTGDLWGYGGAVYQVSHCPPAQQMTGVPTALLVYGFRNPPTASATEPPGTTAREQFWPAPTTVTE